MGTRRHPGHAAVSVLDVEATGLGPGSRIVEIAVLSVDAAGRVVSCWESILDPGRDPGPVRVHGITPAECRAAPPFAEIAAYLHELLVGTVLVAHHARYDWGLLRQEFARCGVRFLREPAVVCTARMCRRAGVPASLERACAALALPPPTHRARADAEAAYRLWQALRERHGEPGIPFVAGVGVHRLPRAAARRPPPRVSPRAPEGSQHAGIPGEVR